MVQGRRHGDLAVLHSLNLLAGAYSLLEASSAGQRDFSTRPTASRRSIDLCASTRWVVWKASCLAQLSPSWVYSLLQTSSAIQRDSSTSTTASRRSFDLCASTRWAVWRFGCFAQLTHLLRAYSLPRSFQGMQRNLSTYAAGIHRYSQIQSSIR